MNDIRLFFAGDFVSRPSTSILSVSDDLKALISSCDLRIINFEAPLKPDVEVPPIFRERFYQHKDVPDFLMSIGFNLFSLANNHICDWGDDGLKKTKSVFQGLCFGAGTYEESLQVHICEINGVRIGFLAVCFAAYAGVFSDVMSREGLGCAYINDLAINHCILEARKKVDYLFVLPHDGIEYVSFPLPELRARYRDFIDYGADGVIGTHPHCPQGWELYKGKPVFYSLGNFFFNSKENDLYRVTNRPHWYDGRCVVVTLTHGDMKWEVINVRNRDNVCIEVDDREESNEYNNTICHILCDDNAYVAALNSLCEEIGYHREMRILDKTVHAFHLKESFQQILLCLKDKVLCRKKTENMVNYSVFRLLSYDARRDLIKRSLMSHFKD